MIELYNSLFRTLYEGWIKGYKKYPKSTLIVTLCISAGIVTLVIFQGIDQEKIRESQS